MKGAHNSESFASREISLVPAIREAQPSQILSPSHSPFEQMGQKHSGRVFFVTIMQIAMVLVMFSFATVFFRFITIG